ncbi:MAG: hypothetical protein K2Z81_27780 [Cyanobacteria bacterium]|nr:hypothetical protein [Cyanobacteriota bacterium]
MNSFARKSINPTRKALPCADWYKSVTCWFRGDEVSFAAMNSQQNSQCGQGLRHAIRRFVDKYNLKA